ncbi:cytochrome P450 [Aspergillus spinulosporus]
MSELRQLSVFLFLLSIPFLVGYLISWGMYHWINLRRKTGTSDKQVAPDLPLIFPIVGHTVQFLFNSAAFVKNETTYWGQLTCVRISLLGGGVYLVQDPEAVAAMWKTPDLCSPIYIYVVGLRYLFGMKERAIEIYAADDSGPFRKPHSKSQVMPHNRVDFLTHDSLLRGLLGPGLAPSFERFQTILGRAVERLPIQDEWAEMPDMLQFFRDHVGRAVLVCLFGPALLEINPTFMENIWAFDAATPYLAKRVPRLFYPKGYRVRDTLLQQIQCWYQHARSHFDASQLDANGDGDPFWGSAMVRERQEFILKFPQQDDASLASADLGLMWSSVTSVIPSVMMCLLHIFADAELLSRSIYAETLRLYVQSYVTRCSAHAPADIGAWRLPQNKVAMVSSYVAHMDDNVWNTQDGAQPLTKFWADRFLVDPHDTTGRSGPLRRERRAPRTAGVDAKCDLEERAEKPRFSLRGLEGFWIPYGGGFGACPGRFFAKRVILFTCALFVTQFDVDIKTRDFSMDSSAFGLGTQKPKQKIVFAIKRREFRS